MQGAAQYVSDAVCAHASLAAFRSESLVTLTDLGATCAAGDRVRHLCSRLLTALKQLNLLTFHLVQEEVSLSSPSSPDMRGLCIAFSAAGLASIGAWVPANA